MDQEARQNYGTIPGFVLDPTFPANHVLRHIQGLRLREMAERMGRSVDSVKKLWARAIARIRHVLGDSL